MRKSIMLSCGAAALALMLSAGTASAQATRPRAGADAEARREWMKEHRGEVKARWEALTPEQKEAFKAQREAYMKERKSLMEQVKAGTLDRKTAAEKLKAWREANKPKKP